MGSEMCIRDRFLSSGYELFCNGFFMHCHFRYYYLEDIEMNDFKDEYRNLKDSINSDNSKIVSFLVLGVLLGRLIEKFYNLKKRLRRKK